MTFRQFAFNNVRRNARAYAAYFLSSAFSVMIFFVFAMFIFHPDLRTDELGNTARMGMEVAEYTIFVFSFLFLLYSVSAFLKVRKKEFGVLTILGMTRRQITRLLFLENMLIGLASTLTGMVVGMVFAKLFFLLAANVMKMQELTLYLPFKAAGLTSLAFLVLFLTISLLTQVMIRSSEVIELLQGSKKPLAEPKASLLLSLLSAGTLITGYTMAVKSEASQSVLLTILGLTLIGTYFLFTQLSVYVIRRLKKQRRFFWRGINLLWVSDLAYRMKDNARMFFLVTIVSAVAFTATGAFLYLDKQNQQILTDIPFSYYYLYTNQMDEQQAAAHKEHIEQQLRQERVQYEKLSATVLYQHKDEDNRLNVMKYSEFKRLAEQLDRDVPELPAGEALILASRFMPLDYQPDAITLQESHLTYRVSQPVQPTVLPYLIEIVVVPDADFAHVKPVAEGDTSRTYQVYAVDQWKQSVPDTSSQETQIGATLSTELVMDHTKPYMFTSRATSYVQSQQMTATAMFVGLFVVVIFFIAAGSFLYFRLYSDLEQDKSRYQAVSKIGLTDRELTRTSTIQIALLFFLPFFVAVVHSYFALVVLQKAFNTSVATSAAIGTGAFFLLQLLYFLLIRNRYLARLKKALV